MFNNRPIASFASTTVFKEERTRSGTGRYCSAVRDAAVIEGVVDVGIDIAWERMEPGE